MRPLVLLILFSCVFIVSSFFNGYCASNCHEYMGTCYSQSYSDNSCVVCAVSIYNQDPDPVTNNCVLNNQTTVLTVDLQSPISYVGFTGSTLTPFSCGGWVLSGKYVEGGYLTKKYDTPTNHYMVVLRYNLIYMGDGWSPADAMTVTVDSNTTTFGYKCAYPTTICNTKDCPKIGQIKATHNASTALVTFTSNILNSSGSSWGISNLIVVLLTCNPSCNTCFGPKAHQCLSCSNSSYLLGNTCVKQCPVMSVPNLNLCAAACPGGFYPISTTNSCSPCSRGCSVCTGPLQKNCVLSVTQLSLWQQQKPFWIFLMVLGGLVIAVGLMFLALKRRRQKTSNLKQPIIQQSKTPNLYPNLSEMDISNMMMSNEKTNVCINDKVDADRSQTSSSNSNSSDDGPKPIKVRRKWKGKE